MAIAKASERFYPNLKDVVPYHAEFDHYQLRKMIYDLLDVKPEIADYTLTADTRIDANLVAGRLLIIIARQNSVGGWTLQWATNPDGSLKFKGIASIAAFIDKTANTYAAFMFIATSTTEALLLDVTGGDLS